MKLRELGTSGIQVSALSLGCMSFHDLETGRAIIREAEDAGINFFDTADLYDKGENERILGQLFQHRRQEVILATKVGNRWRSDGSGWDWVPRKAYILAAVEESLKRLKTDYIDLYQLHGGTVDDPLEEVIEAFELLQSQGKIRAYGISSIRPNTIRKWVATGNGQACMTQYSMLDRRSEEANLDHLATAGQSVLVRGALAKGLLAGKPAKAYLKHSEETVAGIQQQLSASGASAGLAVAYTLAHPAVATVVLGASQEGQLSSVLQAWKTTQTNQPDMTSWRDQLPVYLYEQHR